jgi:predicted transcriptional regulator
LMEGGRKMYRNLMAEMVRRNLTVDDLAKIIKIDPRTLRNRIYGRTDFKWPEVTKIRDNIAPDKTLEELFEKSSDNKTQ